MCLINDNAEVLVLQLRAYSFEYVWELMHDGNDNLLAVLQGILQCLRRVCPVHKIRQSLEGVDVVSNLGIKIHAVGHNYHCV